MSGGWNPLAGHDQGPRPPMGPVGHPLMRANQAYIPHQGGVHGGMNGGVGFMAAPQVVPQMMPQVVPQVMPQVTVPQYQQYQVPMQQYLPVGGGYQQHQQGLYAGPTHNPYQVAPGIDGRFSQPVPRIDPDLPAAQMTNSTGGLGCEPGYNYFFPAEHTKIHVFLGSTPPWQLPTTAAIPFKAIHVPCNLTCGEFLKGIGCTNPNKKKNQCWEITSNGNGRWCKGLHFSEDQKDKCAMTLKDIGWDQSRSGHKVPGHHSVVCIYATKD